MTLQNLAPTTVQTTVADPSVTLSNTLVPYESAKPAGILTRNWKNLIPEASIASRPALSVLL